MRREDPEINFIPLIDLLLVILIFLMVTTTYSKFSELQVNLPSAAVDPAVDRPIEIAVSVGADGRYAIDGTAVAFRDAPAFAQALARGAQGRREPTVVVYADAGASNQAVVNVLEAARLARPGNGSSATQTGRA
ncbi:MAG TPA: biopolymer transporter ExbD, partial [Burkholderiaceae bacterium]|nr:biopolymer transporter ExbD [Burkholderiaceae bacterium]